MLKFLEVKKHGSPRLINDLRLVQTAFPFHQPLEKIESTERPSHFGQFIWITNFEISSSYGKSFIIKYI